MGTDARTNRGHGWLGLSRVALSRSMSTYSAALRVSTYRQPPPRVRPNFGKTLLAVRREFPHPVDLSAHALTTQDLVPAGIRTAASRANSRRLTDAPVGPWLTRT